MAGVAGSCGAHSVELTGTASAPEVEGFMIIGKRILVTGASGAVGSAIATALAPANEVWGLARFTDPQARRRLDSAGVRPVVADLAALDTAALPEVDHVLHFAVDMFMEPDFERAHRNNVEPAGRLLSHYRGIESFLHCSSTVVYEPNPQPRRETDPLGDYMRALLPTYSISKIAAEAVVRTCATLFGVPTTIARLNVPYGDATGLPLIHLQTILAGHPVAIHPDSPNVYAPIHIDDMVRTLPALLAAAATPATVVNWGGDEQVDVAEWATYLGELVGKEVTLFPTEYAIKGMCPDVERLRGIVGGPICTVGWRDGFRRMAKTLGAGS
jgi:nucleoside-diphosphate-sugar epimerase